MAAGGLAAVVDRDQLERGFRRLSVEHRMVAVLRHHLDLPMERVAETLGDPIGTAHPRLHPTPQRRATWWPTWRYNDMNPIQRLAVTAAAAVLVIAVAYGVLVRPNVGQETEPTPSPSATAIDPGVGDAAFASPPASDPTPGAAAVTLPPVEFTVCVPHNSPIRTGTAEEIVLPEPNAGVSVEHSRGNTWQGTITASDPRLSGTHNYTWEEDRYTLPGGNAGPVAWAEGHYFENDEGSWQGSSVGFSDPDETSVGGVAVLVGAGGYEGLTAVITGTDGAGEPGIDGPCFLNFRGYIMAAPEAPVPYTGD
jgi:hypothetical protein